MTSDSRGKVLRTEKDEGGKARQSGKTAAGRAAPPRTPPAAVPHLTAPAPARPTRGRPVPRRLPPCPVTGRRGLTCRRRSPLLRAFPRRLPSPGRPGPPQLPPFPASSLPDYDRPKAGGGGGAEGGPASRWRRPEARGLTAPLARAAAGDSLNQSHDEFWIQP